MKKLVLTLLFAILCFYPLLTIGRTIPPNRKMYVRQQSLHDFPILRISVHDIGNFVLSVDSYGGWGGTPVQSAGLFPDYVTGEYISDGSEFPKGSKRNLLYDCGLWIGGIVGIDTLVTTAIGVPRLETAPETVNGREIDYRSILDSIDLKYRGAISQQDRIIAYSDTVIFPWNYYNSDCLDRYPHKPLGIRVDQETYAWSYSYANSIIFFNVRIKNISNHWIKKAYIGNLIIPLVSYISSIYDPNSYYSDSDEICGFIREFTDMSPCNYIDTVNVAWTADADGDPLNGEWIDEPVFNPVTQSSYASVRSIIGFKYLSKLDANQKLFFNWWIPWGYIPMEKEHYRNFRTDNYMNHPCGDKNFYYLLHSDETDYDQAFAATINSDSKWTIPPANEASDIADGSYIEMLLSEGPFDLAPNASIQFAFCVAAAENFHLDPHNGENLPDNPYQWYANVDFSGLIKKIHWAEKIYDTPGIDTDGDGYAGEYRICNLDSSFVDGEWVYTYTDTTWYKGDGAPDWLASGPPLPPYFWLTPTHNGIHVRINGQQSETTPDVLSRKIDFEGYRIYIARDDREASYSLLASYDKENYDKHVYEEISGQWVIQDDPLTLSQLRCLYGSGADPCNDTLFDPLNYYITSPYQPPEFPDSFFFFTKHGYNVSELGNTTPIRKRFPDVTIDPSKLPADSLTDDMYTEDGYFKYFEYEFEITNLLPTVAYWVNVTAFDHGSPATDLFPQETPVTLHAQSAFPLHNFDAPLSGSDKVYVYPNPYRIDGGYRRPYGYEGRGHDDLPDDKVRAIWFANLPPKCTIKIFTIDGDRVRTLEHDTDITDPTYSHHRWDLINRNYQRIVSGLYYWTVETPDGDTQVGKLVIIR